MNRYVDVPRAEITSLLEKAGFHAGHSGNELTYTRLHDKDTRLSVTVYTSVAAGKDEARFCGEDAIRVVALFRWTHRATGEERRKNLYKARVYRVNSVAGVLERTLEKMREAYAACNQFRKERPAAAVPGLTPRQVVENADTLALFRREGS